MVRACIALGSNLDDPRAQVRRAIDALSSHPDLRDLRASRLYGSLPVGPTQPDYVNAAVAVDTDLAPLDLLDLLQAQEAVQLRRHDGERWGARTLDLDLLLYGRETVDHVRLQVPHPRLAEREFALRPLADVCPDCTLPDLGVTVAEHLASLTVSDGTVWLLD